MVFSFCLRIGENGESEVVCVFFLCVFFFLVGGDVFLFFLLVFCFVCLKLVCLVDVFFNECFF